MASTDEGRWLEGIQHPEQHDPLCPESWQPGYYLCICDRLRQAEQRGREAAAKHHEGECEGHEWTLVETQAHWYAKGREDAARDVAEIDTAYEGCSCSSCYTLRLAVAAARGEQA